MRSVDYEKVANDLIDEEIEEKGLEWVICWLHGEDLKAYQLIDMGFDYFDVEHTAKIYDFENWLNELENHEN